MMGAELAAVAPRVAPKGSIQLPIRSVQSRADLLGQPIRRLERPAAAHTPKRIGRLGSIADKDHPPRRGGSDRARHLELSGPFRDRACAVEARNIRQTPKMRPNCRLRIAAKVVQPLLGQHHRDHRDAILVRVDVGQVGVAEPDHPPVRDRAAGHS